MQDKYEEATASIAEMEKRVVMAESMLEATLQYQSGQVKAQPSPRFVFNFGSIFLVHSYFLVDKSEPWLSLYWF